MGLSASGLFALIGYILIQVEPLRRIIDWFHQAVDLQQGRSRHHAWRTEDSENRRER